MRRLRALLASAFALTAPSALAATLPALAPKDVFDLEWVSAIDVAPDGERILFLRNAFDLMRDSPRNALWLSDGRGDGMRPVALGFDGLSTPRFSPDGRRIAFVATPSNGKGAQLFVHWLASGDTVPITQLLEAPQSLAWSPDGRQIAFLMRVPEKPEPIAKLPDKPEGATWAPEPRVVERLIWRRDGAGYVKPGYVQLFVVPADGGTARQLTEGPYAHGGEPAWLPDGKTLIVSGNRRDDWEYEPQDTELYRVDVASGAIEPLTDRFGPDFAPEVSPDGRSVAYLGYDDDRRSHIDAALWLMDLRSRASKRLSPELPGAVDTFVWSSDGRSLVAQYDVEGDTRLARLGLDGRLRDLVTSGVGGLDLGRPYSAASFDVGGGTLAFTTTTPQRPADLATLRGNGATARRTAVNEDLLGQRALATVESRWVTSPADGARIHAWVVKPPDFDPGRRYPLILEIHGGPHTNYGPRFAAEMQLFAAAGYVVLYTNPRGSTSYGEDFANLIDKDYPGRDYDDLMAAVDALAAEPWIDDRNLFVTGGSGGGILTAWIVGQTQRFRAAVAAKPVINWTSFMMTSDIGENVSDRWFRGFPWDHPEEYLRRSPISLVARVETPTMLLTGEDDFRTPMSESEQFYQALRIRKVPTALVRFPDASHALVTRPSQLAAKVAYILGWFERYRVRD
jgi:acylaminoacyl-peptidase